MAPGGYGVWRSHSPSLTTPDHKTGYEKIHNEYIYLLSTVVLHVCLFVLNV